MKIRAWTMGGSLALLALAGCQDKAGNAPAVAKGSAPEGTISDELPDMDLLPNDAPLADPADLPPVPGIAPVAPSADGESPAAAPAVPPAAPAPAEPVVEGSIAG
jgi:hypothetical protein